MSKKHYYKFDYVRNFSCDYYELGDGLPSIDNACDEMVERLAYNDNAYIRPHK